MVCTACIMSSGVCLHGTADRWPRDVGKHLTGALALLFLSACSTTTVTNSHFRALGLTRFDLI